MHRQFYVLLPKFQLMTKQDVSILPVSCRSVLLRMLLGAAIGLGIISFFVFSVGQSNPEWGEFWRVRPLIITPLAGAFGILAFYLKNIFRTKSRAWTVVLNILSTLAFLFALWLGTILGLSGTLWD